MGYVNAGNVHVDRHLTGVAQAYMPMGFVADKIAPVIQVAKQSDLIVEWPQDDWFRVDQSRRAPGTEAFRVEFQVTSQRYFAQNYALKVSVPIEDDANADEGMRMMNEEGRTKFLKSKLLLDWDKRVLSQVGSTTNVGTSATVTSAWSTRTGNSAPLENIWTMMDNLHDANGYRPNRILFGNLAWRSFHRHNTVIDKIRETGVTGGALNPTTADVAALLQVEDVMVAGAYENTAAEGIAQSLSAIFNDSVLIYYAPFNASVEEPSFMYSFRWTAPGLANWQVERHPFDSKKKAQEIEMGYYQDEVITGQRFGALITGTDSSQ